MAWNGKRPGPAILSKRPLGPNGAEMDWIECYEFKRSETCWSVNVHREILEGGPIQVLNATEWSLDQVHKGD